ncbi:hypothetical protein ALO_15417 [Acetonema longum DSM 6540]|uniref:Uncharacterized protein n=1 Tax=Acetonema longum DSM 6540 TaxID=1009370 RepID=F7NLV9_9FIRM|nr:hypothetical protein ALO_15417 [Acetonema longum DSM 6540]
MYVHRKILNLGYKGCFQTKQKVANNINAEVKWDAYNEAITDQMHWRV